MSLHRAPFAVLALSVALLFGTAAAYDCISGKDNNSNLNAPYDESFIATSGWRSCWRLYANGVRHLMGSSNDCSSHNDHIHDRFPSIGWLTATDRAYTCCEGPNLCNSNNINTNAASSLRPVAMPMMLALLAAALLSSMLA